MRSWTRGQRSSGVDFDANERWLTENLFVRLAKGHADIRDAKAFSGHLYALFLDHPDAQFLLSGAQVKQDGLLQLGMALLAHVSFEDLPIDVVAIRTVTRPEVLFDGDQRPRGHMPNISRNIVE